MKVLQLCNKPPIPTVDGGCIAINTISQGLLQKGIDLKIVTVSTAKHPFLPDKIPADFKEKTNIEGIYLDTSVNVVDAFSALVTSDSYNVSRFFSTDFDRLLIELLRNNTYDLIHLESLFMTPYVDTIRKLCDTKIVLRSHNLEHLIWQRLANSTGNTAKRMYLKHLASRLMKYEKRMINEVDGIAAISFEDTRRFKEFGCTKPLVTIPFGIDLSDYNYQPKTEGPFNNIFHIGSMDWVPNQEAVNWFIDSIWPLVRDEDLRMHLAGRKMPDYLTRLGDQKMLIHGEVEDAQQFMNAYDIMVVPLLSASGIRIKIIEAMALGKAVISTKVGAEGIAYTEGENIIIANSEEDIAAAIHKLTGDPELVKKIGSNARKLIEEHYDNSKIIDNLIEFYKS